jgi:hypothetical protein
MGMHVVNSAILVNRDLNIVVEALLLPVALCHQRCEERAGDTSWKERSPAALEK